ncbi:hypothetical protein [Nocardia sp. NPDC005366]|uniref:hypothetical protein n=1 Tax=Nocardia sp. NPDC005366 TaxID=3156878 RepID=UPI0033B4F82C
MSTRKKNTPAKRPTPATPAAAPAAAATPAAVDVAHGDGAGAGVPVLRTDTEKAVWAALGRFPGFTVYELAGAAGASASATRRILTGWETAGVARSQPNPASPRAAKTWTTTTEQTTTAPAEPEPAESTAPANTETAEPITTEPGDGDVAEPGDGGTAEPEPGSAPAESDATPRPDSDAAPAEPAPAEPAPPVAAPEPAPAAPTDDESATPAPDAPTVDPDAVAGQSETIQKLAPGALRGQVEDFLRDHPGQEFSPHQIGKALDRSSGAVHNALVKLTTGGTARQTSAAPKKFTLADA